MNAKAIETFRRNQAHKKLTSRLRAAAYAVSKVAYRSDVVALRQLCDEWLARASVPQEPSNGTK